MAAPGRRRAAWTLPAFLRLPALGLAITLCQITLLLAISGQGSLPEGLASLASWDGEWFRTIIDEGYQWDSARLVEERYQSNVCFFPGFPVAAGLLQRVSGLSTPLALVLTAQLACWGFWTYFLLLLRRWGTSPGAALVGVLAIALYPSAFFLVAGYSESLFLMAMLGMIYWSRRAGPGTRALAALHGLVMCAARFVGLALLAYPVLQSWLRRPAAGGIRARLRASWPQLVTAALAGLGVLGYFAYCQFRFGRWDLYLFASRVGWNTYADFRGALRPGLYWPRWPLRSGEAFNPEHLSSWFPPLLILLWGGLLLAEWRGKRRADRGRHVRAALYATSALLLYLTVASKVEVRLSSLSRLSLPVYVLLVLAAVHRLRTVDLRGKRAVLAALILLGLLSLTLQVFLSSRFTHMLWVA
jgi:hypothetical protein